MDQTNIRRIATLRRSDRSLKHREPAQPHAVICPSCTHTKVPPAFVGSLPKIWLIWPKPTERRAKSLKRLQIQKTTKIP